jgi:hypothetical protein
MTKDQGCPMSTVPRIPSRPLRRRPYGQNRDSGHTDHFFRSSIMIHGKNSPSGCCLIIAIVTSSKQRQRRVNQRKITKTERCGAHKNEGIGSCNVCGATGKRLNWARNKSELVPHNDDHGPTPKSHDCVLHRPWRRRQHGPNGPCHSPRGTSWSTFHR